MKKLLLLLLIMPFFGLAQTSLKDDDIYAARGNQYEWLLTNIGVEREGGFYTNHLLHRMGFMYKNDGFRSDYRSVDNYIKNAVSGNEIPAEIKVTYDLESIKGFEFPFQKKITIEGDTEYIITFFVNFWSRAINFRDIKPGETATVRFLTDVAALTVGKNGKSKIVVQTAKDYYE